MEKARASSDDATTALRAERLLDYIKAETRWQLLATPARGFAVNEDGFYEERAALVRTWPEIRNRRVPSAFLVAYYDFATDQASRLALLIEIRRQRARDRVPQ